MLRNVNAVNAATATATEGISSEIWAVVKRLVNAVPSEKRQAQGNSVHQVNAERTFAERLCPRITQEATEGVAASYGSKEQAEQQNFGHPIGRSPRTNPATRDKPAGTETMVG